MLSDEQIDGFANGIHTADPVVWWRKLARAIESAATEPLLKRIAELERHNKALVERRQHDVSDILDGTEKLVKLEQELEAVRNEVLEEAAAVASKRGSAFYPESPFSVELNELAAAIRSLKT